MAFKSRKFDLPKTYKTSLFPSMKLRLSIFSNGFFGSKTKQSSFNTNVP